MCVCVCVCVNVHACIHVCTCVRACGARRVLESTLLWNNTSPILFYCTVLYYVVLYCTVLCYAAPCCSVYTVLNNYADCTIDMCKTYPGHYYVYVEKKMRSFETGGKECYINA